MQKKIVSAYMKGSLITNMPYSLFTPQSLKLETKVTSLQQNQGTYSRISTHVHRDNEVKRKTSYTHFKTDNYKDIKTKIKLMLGINKAN